ncbi:MAG: PUA domain-containing protein [Nitrososphaerales archaeon]
MRSYTLSKRDARTIIDRMTKTWPVTPEFSKSIQVRIVKIDEHKHLLIFTNLEAIELEDLLIPTLKNTELLQSFPYIEVDQGAVSYICNGADVMRPGIVGWAVFKKGDIVSIRESKYKKFIAIGIALINESDMGGMSKGAVAKNVHYIGDKLWATYKQP